MRAVSYGLCVTTLILISIPSCSTSVNPYSFHFLLEPEPCLDEDLVIIVHNAVRYIHRRHLMRNTWLSRSYLEDKLQMKIKIVFVTAVSDNITVTSQLQREHQRYRDILQASFIDSYKNNTYKAMTYLKWVSDRCSDSKLVLKVDDDALLKSSTLPRLKSLLDTISQSSRHVYAGHENIYGRVPVRDQEGPYHQWYVSRDQWPDDTYPLWYQGLVYILTTPLVQKISRLSTEQPYLFVDDVFVGILVSKVPDTTYMTVQYISATGRYDADYELVYDLYELFYYDVVIFYHLPSVRVFMDWWRCAENTSCKPPCLVMLCRPVLYFIVFSIITFIALAQKRRIRTFYRKWSETHPNRRQLMYYV